MENLDSTSDKETILRQRILAGSAALDDYIELADILYVDGRSEATLEILREASSLNLPPPERGLLLNEQAQFSFVITGRADEALAFAEKAASILRQYSSTPATFFAEISAEGLISKILWDTNRPRALETASSALSKIQRATDDDRQYDPETLSMMYIVASRLYALSGQLEQATEWARRALAQEVGENHRIAPLVELGSLLRQSGRNEEAKKTMEAALDLATRLTGRQNPAIYHELGCIEFSLGNLKESSAFYERALQIVETDEYLRRDHAYVATLSLNLAAALNGLGDYRAQAQVHHQLLGILREDEPNYWVCRLYLAGCDAALKRFEDTRENLETIIKSEAAPDDVRDSARADLFTVRYSIALRDYEARSYQSAIAQLESLLVEAIGDDRLRSNVLLSLGHSCCESRRFSEARAYYEELINSASAPQYHRDAATASIGLLPKSRFPDGSGEMGPPKRVN